MPVAEIPTWAGSAACLNHTENGSFLVTEIGPRALWNEVERLHQQWQTWGRPHRERYGLTANEESRIIWLDEPRDADLTLTQLGTLGPNVV